MIALVLAKLKAFLPYIIIGLVAAAVIAFASSAGTSLVKNLRSSAEADGYKKASLEYAEKLRVANERERVLEQQLGKQRDDFGQLAQDMFDRLDATQSAAMERVRNARPTYLNPACRVSDSVRDDINGLGRRPDDTGTDTVSTGDPA